VAPLIVFIVKTIAQKLKISHEFHGKFTKNIKILRRDLTCGAARIYIRHGGCGLWVKPAMTGWVCAQGQSE
jgi:hypothetical protein